MMENKNIYNYHHGGALDNQDILYDFSVNTNPYNISQYDDNSYTESLKYPDIEYKNLKYAISNFENVDSENILCTNGSSELFSIIDHAFKPKKVLLTAPSFIGYRKAFVDSDIRYHYTKEHKGFALDEDILNEDFKSIDLLVLGDPNNPNGKVIDKELFSQLVEKCYVNRTILLVDQCFYPFTGNRLEIRKLIDKYDNLIIAKGFTKIFAHPGIRLGYAVANSNTIYSLHNYTPEWNISAQAESFGIKMCAHTDFVSESVRNINASKAKMTNALEQLKIKIYDSDVNFILIKTDVPLFEELLKQHILIRQCDDFEGLSKDYYRVAVKSDTDNDILLKAITKIVEKYEK